MTHYLLPIYLVVAAVALLVWSRLFSKKTPLPPTKLAVAAASLQTLVNGQQKTVTTESVFIEVDE